MSGRAPFASYDAIKFPSTRCNDESFNIVILNDDLSLDRRSTVTKIEHDFDDHK